jgi:hypothetical protein
VALGFAVTSRRLVILVIGSSVGCDARQLVSFGVIEPILEGRVSELDERHEHKQQS